MMTNSAIDVGYIISLLERPKQPVTLTSKLSPDRWPSITVKTQLLYETDWEKPLVEAPPAMEELFGNGWGAWSFDTEQDQVNRETNWSRKNRFSEDEMRINYKKDSLLEFLAKDTLEQSNVDTIFTDRKSLASKKPTLPLEKSAIEQQLETKSKVNTATPRLFSMVTDVNFGDVKDKTICLVLAKAFGYDLGQQNEKGNNDSINNAIDITSFDATTIVNNDKCEDKGLKTPEKIMVLNGVELHLLEYGQLQRLASLFKIQSNKATKNAIERAICKFYKELDQKTLKFTPTASVDLDDCQSSIKCFIKSSIKETIENDLEEETTSRKKKVIWTIEEERRLKEQGTITRELYNRISSTVEEYLLEHNSKPEESTALSCEDIGIWEVIAKDLPGKTPKACKKHWIVLDRVELFASMK